MAERRLIACDDNAASVSKLKRVWRMWAHSERTTAKVAGAATAIDKFWICKRPRW